MALTAADIISVAAGQVGYKEKASNYNLDSATGNAGGNNYTKYARDLANAGYYQASKQGYEWCDVFVDWCFWMASGKNKTAAEAAECQTGLYGAGCDCSAQYYRNKGRYDRNPKAGDQIFFGTVGDEEHTGIVEKVSGGYVYTIEGNSGNCVCRHTYPESSQYIAGYGHPIYTGAGTTAKTETNTETKTEGKIMVELNEISKGSKGAQVKTVQRLLIAQGYNCGGYGADGDCGSGTDASIRAFQRANGLTADGIVGQNTWNKLLKG